MMINKFFKTSILMFSFLSLSGFYNTIIENVNTHNIRDQSRFQLISIFNSCIQGDRVDGDCIVRRLTPLSQQVPAANQIMRLYNFTLSQGKMHIPECQRPEFLQTNQTCAYCVLLMHKEALETSSKEAAIVRFQECIQGALITLAYDGNIAAIMRLSQIFKETGDVRAQKIWQNILTERQRNPQDVEALSLLKTCYSFN